MVATGRHGEGIEFLDLDMRLVRDIVYLFAEEMGEHSGLHTKDLIWILGKKGYGRDKVRNTLLALSNSMLLIRRMSSRRGKRFYSYRLSANWDYSAKFFKSNKQWGETAPLFNDIRKECEILKNQDFKEREKGGM